MMQNKRYAITGGIGSGKSAVCNILKEKGYAVFSCDEISRELWRDTTYRRELAILFPDCTKNGEIEKDKLVNHVFTDANALKQLNAFAHPRIMQELLKSTSECQISFSEVPLLFEGGFEDLFDGVIAVRRLAEMRIKSVALRDGLSENDVAKRMAYQFDPTELETKKCIVLENNGNLRELEEGVEKVLARLGL